ncbi:MAG TPA: ATP-binding protein [Gammaproteobacteria bacterium]|nr:ATP-binding protein [Gammaproteobacteria bacterium]
MFPRLRSVRLKLFIGVLLTSLVAIAITGASLLAYDLHTTRANLTQDLGTQAELIGRACTPALQFDDPKAANDNLALLKARPLIDAAAVYNGRGAMFGHYVRDGAAPETYPQLGGGEDDVRFSGQDVFVNRRIIDDSHEIVGFIYLHAHYNIYDRARSYLGIVLGVGSLALMVALLLSLWMQLTVTRPILSITGLAQQVVERGDYGLRAKKSTDDEIGYLVDAFNRMLGEIGGRTEALEASNRELGHEIAERKSAELALRTSEKRYRALVSTLSTVVWVANRQWEFEGEQPSWEAYTGQGPNEYRGSGWRRAFHPEDLEVLERFIGEASRGRQAPDIELRLWQAASGQYRIVSLRPVAVHDGAGEFREWIGTVSDIDDRRRAEEEIYRLNQELEERVRDRTRKLEEINGELEAFSYSVSHDLRAPLRAMDGFSQRLLQDYGPQLDSQAKGYLDRIRNGASRMGQLIEDLLSLSRITRLQLNRVDVDVSALAQQVLHELQQRDPERKVDTSVWDGVRVDADVRLVRVALENLLGNAWKFSSKTEHPRVEFGMMQEGERKVMFVRDNGAGFDMAYADKLFGPFQRLHGMHEFPGTGIGLATVHRIVTRHGGDIWCQAKPGGGATFFFTLQEDPRRPAGTDA